MLDAARDLSPEQRDWPAEVARLKKIITVLMDRAERSTSAEATDFGLFQTTIMLEQQVRKRTAELEAALREKQRMNRALLQATQQFERAFEHAPIGMALVGLDGTWLKVNRMMCVITGYSEPELLRMSFRDITLAEDLEQSLDGLRRLQSGQIYQAEKRYVHAEGQVIWVRLAVSVVCDEHGLPQHFVAQTEDVTESKRLRARLQQAQGFESIGALAGGVAHDFNTLLAVIFNYVGLIRDDLPPDSQLRDDIDAIGSAAERGARLTDQLLAFAQRKTVETEALDAGVVISELRSLLDRSLGTETELRCEHADELWPIEAARSDLEQILLNLIVNARDATSCEGHITVSTVNVELTGDRAAELDVAAGRYVRVSVADDGCGIDPDLLIHVWEPFFTTKAPGQGSGLGLATVYGVVRRTGGGVAISSTLGSGTRVDVYLPVSESRFPTDATPSALREDALSLSAILVVDGDSALRSSVQRILRSAGYTVVVANCGEQALAMLATPEHHFELLLTGMIMPGMWGEELATRAQTLVPDLSVVFMSGHAERTMSRGRLPAPSPMLVKPFSEESLLGEVTKLIGTAPGVRRFIGQRA